MAMRQSDTQRTGDRGEGWVRSVLEVDIGWIPTPPDKDVGVDFNVVVDEDSDIDGRQFQVQVKTLMSSISSEQKYVKVRGIKVRTIRFWFLCPVPTLIIACDLERKTSYFVWHSECYGLLDGKKAKDSVTITIPTENELNSNKGWDQIRRDLRAYYGNLSTLIGRGRHALQALPTIHDLAAVVRRLNDIDHQSIPKERRTPQQEGILALMELTHYRLVSTSLRNLLDSLNPNSDNARRFSNWVQEFENRIEKVFPTFSTLTDWNNVPPDFELSYYKPLHHSLRPQMIEAILEVIMALAPGRFTLPFNLQESLPESLKETDSAFRAREVTEEAERWIEDRLRDESWPRADK